MSRQIEPAYGIHWANIAKQFPGKDKNIPYRPTNKNKLPSLNKKDVELVATSAILSFLSFAGRLNEKNADPSLRRY